MNTAVLTGKKVVMPVRTVAVEEDGVVTDVSDYMDCSSDDEDVLKVAFTLPSPLYPPLQMVEVLITFAFIIFFSPNIPMIIVKSYFFCTFCGQSYYFNCRSNKCKMLDHCCRLRTKTLADINRRM